MTRITQAMLYRQSLTNIQNNLRGSTQLQTQIASGIRVHRPSDDPVAMLRIVPLKNEIRSLDQNLDNIELARSTLDTATASLEDASSIMQRVRELTVQGANGALSETDRRSIAGEIDQILSQMVSIANANRAGRSIFGGTSTDGSPFELIDNGSGTAVRYRGNDERLEINIAPNVDTEINIPGDEIFQNHQRGATTFDGTTGATSAPGIDTGVGADRLTIGFAGLTLPGTITGIAAGSGTTTALGPMNYTFTAPNQLSINGGPNITVSGGDNDVQVGSDPNHTISLNLTLPISPTTGTFTSRASLSLDGGATTTETDFTSSSIRVTDSVDGSKLNVDVSALNNVGTERIRYEGTFDVFSTLIAVRDILRNESNEPQAVVSQRLTDSLGDIDNAHEQILTALRNLGFRADNMSLVQNRVENLKTGATESMSLERDTDIVEAIVDFNQRNSLYQASLQVSAGIVQTSLLNFLR
ncbi:MAG: flagellar hook-associated protein FlgL [Planctomycetes bacterium]|nr:flagellar hook-associated protein FlgL [Planctomycetota bacterium]